MGKKCTSVGFFFDKTIIPFCICLKTWCVNLQPFSFSLARFNAVSRWAKDFLSRASIYFLSLFSSVRSVCLFFYFLSVGANLSASWSQSSKKEKDRERMK